MRLEEGQNLVEEHRVERAFLLVERTGQLSLELGLGLERGSVSGRFLIAHESHALAQLEVLGRARHAVQDGEQLHLQAGGDIGAGTVLVRLVQVLDLAQVGAGTGRLLLRSVAVIDRVRADRQRGGGTVGDGHCR